MLKPCSTCGGPVEEGYKSHRCRSCTREYVRAWRAANKDKHAEQDQRYRNQHRTVENDRRRRFRREKPHIQKEYNHERRAAKKGCEVSRADLLAVVERAKEICAKCGSWVPEELRHIDHIVPLDKGGPHTLDNLRLLCARCNCRKGARPDSEVKPDKWRKRRLKDQPFLFNPEWAEVR